MSKAQNTVRLVDIAAHAAVSRAAVSKALLSTGGERVRVRGHHPGESAAYRPGNGLRTQPGRTLGVVLDTVNTPVMVGRLFALKGEASRRGYRLLIDPPLTPSISGMRIMPAPPWISCFPPVKTAPPRKESSRFNLN